MHYIISKRCFLILFLGLLLHPLIFSQQKEQTYLDQVRENNLEIQALQQWLDQQRLFLKTGLNPSDPTIEYGYFPGNSDAIGTKETFSITQAIDFPVVYRTRGKLADEKITLAEFQAKNSIREVLLNAHLEYLKFVYAAKRVNELRHRYQHTNTVLESYQAKFDQGQASILDLNKAKIQALSHNKSLVMVQQELKGITNNLIALNGGSELLVNDTSYYGKTGVNPDSIAEMVLSHHPRIKYLETEEVIANLQIKQIKQEWFPELEAGYESEAVNEEVFRGVKAGISIPLWNDKNKVKTAKAEALYTQTQFLSEKKQLLNYYDNLSRNLQTISKTLKEYTNIIEELNNVALLDKAMNLGEISVIEYFTELSFYYNIIDEYLDLEYQYYFTWAKLTDFLLAP